MIAEALLNQIDIGRSGKNQGYPMGLNRLESIVDGVMQQTYTLVFSPSGTGKTTFVLYAYIYRPLCTHIDDSDFLICYYSLEMSAEMLFAKLLSMYIFDTFGVEISVKELLSRNRGYILSEEKYQLVLQSLPWLRKVEQHLIIFDKGLNADVLYSSLLKELSKRGEFKEDNNRKIYVPNNPNLITNVVIDHLSLVRQNNGRSLKQEMDLISSYLVTLKNMCKISPIVIMQANRDSSSMERRKEGLNNLTINDTKDTGAPAQDAEIIISLFNPFREKLATYHGYDIRQLQSNFRSISVLKNRYGEADVEDCVAFYGKIGFFKEIPKPDEINDYSKFQTTDWLVKGDNGIENIDDRKQTQNLIL